MLINLVHGSKREHNVLLVAGIAYLAAMATLVALSIAVYQKVFTPVTMVTVEADRAGLQLAKFGDVRLHGVLVGEVREITNNGENAVIKVAFEPEAAKKIPENISVEILPTTLFGQKYLDVKVPQRASSAVLSDDTVIPASRVSVNVELQSVLTNLFPLLRSVRPADLNATLYAVAHALEGKGEQIGDTAEQLNDYLAVMNTKLPDLRRDLDLFAQTAETYQLAAPDLIRLLRNATVSARTLSQKQDDFSRTLVGMTRVSRSTRALLSENEQAILTQGRAGVPLLRLLDTYSPEFPCMLQGLSKQRANTENVFNDAIIHQTLELGAPQRKAYDADDAPVYGEVGHGPWCLGLPDNNQIPAPALDLADGSDHDKPGGGLE